MEPDNRLWSDALLAEMKRAGRAAVAAQAAAESCAELVEELARHVSPVDPPAVEAGELSLLRAILPVRDALERMATQADTTPSAPRSTLRTLLRRPERDHAGVLREAVVLLHRQLDAALEGHGVQLDRELGGAVDPERHRVVETLGSAAHRVKTIVRPGCRLRGVQVREADVVAGR